MVSLRSIVLFGLPLLAGARLGERIATKTGEGDKDEGKTCGCIGGGTPNGEASSVLQADTEKAGGCSCWGTGEAEQSGQEAHTATAQEATNANANAQQAPQQAAPQQAAPQQAAPQQAAPQQQTK